MKGQFAAEEEGYIAAITHDLISIPRHHERGVEPDHLRLRDFPDRKLAAFEAASAYGDLSPIIGRRINLNPAVGRMYCPRFVGDYNPW